MPKKLAYLIVHCTDTPEGRMVYPSDIREWHLSPCVDTASGMLIYMGNIYAADSDLPVEVRGKRGRGWRQVGYSDMVLPNGSVHNLVPYDNDDEVETWEITNGVKGINSVARHIVYVGGRSKSNRLPKDTRTQAQRDALALYAKRTIAQYPNIKIGGHNQWANKACPSFDVPEWLRSIGTPEKNIY